MVLATYSPRQSSVGIRTSLGRNRNNAPAQQSGAQNTNHQIPQNVGATAEKYNGSSDWAFTVQKGASARNTNKCNAFVGDVTKVVGAPASVTGSYGKSRYPQAAEWADKNTKIANWRVLGSNETPQPGDVAAYKLPGGVPPSPAIPVSSPPWTRTEPFMGWTVPFSTIPN
jgi:hypothetical protein